MSRTSPDFVSVRRRGTEKDLGAMPLDAFVASVLKEIEHKHAEPAVGP